MEGRWTPLAAKQAIWAVAHLTPQESEDLFRTMGGMKPSKSTLDRLPKRCGQVWEEGRLHFEEQLRESELIPECAATVAVSLDGVMLPMKDGAQAEKRARAAARGTKLAGPTGYQEASCGTVSFLDAQGERLSTIRLARMDLSELKGLPLPKECNGNCNCSGKCRKQKESRTKVAKKPGDARQEIQKDKGAGKNDRPEGGS